MTPTRAELLAMCERAESYWHHIERTKKGTREEAAIIARALKSRLLSPAIAPERLAETVRTAIQRDLWQNNRFSDGGEWQGDMEEIVECVVSALTL